MSWSLDHTHSGRAAPWSPPVWWVEHVSTSRWTLNSPQCPSRWVGTRRHHHRRQLQLWYDWVSPWVNWNWISLRETFWQRYRQKKETAGDLHSYYFLWNKTSHKIKMKLCLPNQGLDWLSQTHKLYHDSKELITRWDRKSMSSSTADLRRQQAQQSELMVWCNLCSWDIPT